MQKEVTVLESGPFQFKILAEWDAESANFFIKMLFEHAEDGKISFELKTRKGSLITEFIITVFEGVLSAILYDVIKIIYKLLKGKKENNKEVKPVYIFTEKEQFVITGDKNSKIPDELKRELFD